MAVTKNLFAIVMACGLAGCAFGQTQPVALGAAGNPLATASLDWDAAFVDRSGTRPVHFLATYLDGKGQTHHLEEWRVGLAHLRRRTDELIDLHADAATTPRQGQPVDYLWQILDLSKRIDHRISSQGMMRAGMLYSYYAMAHVLSRPAGPFAIRAVAEMPPALFHGMTGQWFEITASGQPSTRVCWLASVGIPLRTQAKTKEGWRTNFEIETADTRAFPAAVFAVDVQGFQVRNVEELQDDD